MPLNDEVYQRYDDLRTQYAMCNTWSRHQSVRMEPTLQNPVVRFAAAGASSPHVAHTQVQSSLQFRAASSR